MVHTERTTLKQCTAHTPHTPVCVHGRLKRYSKADKKWKLTVSVRTKEDVLELGLLLIPLLDGLVLIAASRRSQRSLLGLPAL